MELAAPPCEDPGATGDQNKEDSHDAGNYGERQQPARKELPHWECEEIKVQRPAEDRIENAARRPRRIPVERKRWPFRAHAGAGHRGDDQRNHQHDEPQDPLDRQPERLPADVNNPAAQQIWLIRPPQRQEPSIQNEKCGRRKSRKYRPLQAQALKKYISVAEGFEPEAADVIRQGRPAAQNDDADQDKKKDEPASPWRPPAALPLDNFGHYFPPPSPVLTSGIPSRR